MDTTLYKYPRTHHLPWSPGATSDDRIHPSVAAFFEGKEVVVTEKLDGENTSIYSHHVHARSLDSKHHPSRTRVKALQDTIGHDIPPGWRVCGENVYAKHSIHYHFLPEYFCVFGIYDHENNCLSWDETLEYTTMFGLVTVPVLYRGPWNEERIRACWTGISALRGKAVHCDDCNILPEADQQEGYVVRLADAFPYDRHAEATAKYVRKDHVQTDEFWMSQPVVPNWIGGSP